MRKGLSSLEAKHVSSARILEKAGKDTSVLVTVLNQTRAEQTAITWALAEEVPVALMYNSEPYAVMMASPADLRDFAIGFSLSEGILPDVATIRQLLVMPVDGGFTVDLAVDEAVFAAAQLPRRTLEGRSGCGLCGVAEIAGVMRRQRSVRTFSLLREAVLRAFDELPAHQPMNSVNRSVHAAGWCDDKGEVLLVREDVGRHNALDKLLGALVRGEFNRKNGFIVMSSRCSFELVQKTTALGIGGLATISAPTSLALSLAQEAGLSLAAKAGAGIVQFPLERV